MFSFRNFTHLFRKRTVLSRHKSSLGLWNQDITTIIKHEVEKRWAKEVLCNKNDNKDPYYVLPMFPYPSGNLHMGHVRVYSISDTIARFQALDGKNVIHPIGWDSFGLPAENAAIERNILPHIWTDSNISAMKEQLVQLGFNFDWNREISTCNPNYYKWTQYIFLKLFENGLAYQCKAKVNWDPIDETVLADEQVDDSGCSWRSGAKVEEKVLTQWFIKTTKYAKQLYDGLDSKSLENWKDIINLQKHWIGDCNGIVVNFHINVKNQQRKFDVWSPDPYKFIYGEYLTMSKDNVMIKDMTLVETQHLKCYNPVTKTDMLVYVTDTVNYPEGRDVYIACPSVDSEDFKLSLSLNIPIVNKNKIVDIHSENKRAIDIAQKLNIGGYFVNSKLKDWLISRQRFWGTPIPIIHCPNCGIVPVPYEDLPVVLPEISVQETKIATLSSFKSWLNCKCPKCFSIATRESDTMDTFVDSSWYYYRFLDPNNDKKPFDKEKLIGVTPVNCYIGGKEHAVLHLYYTRFMSYFLHSLGLTPTQEPFKKLLVQGMIMGQSFKTKNTGKYLPPEDVEKVGKEYKEKKTGQPVLVQWEKMSKSKYNGENPQRLLSTYGCDTTRLLILADVPPATSRRWSDATLPGVLNFQHRLWITIREFLMHKQNKELFAVNELSEKEIQECENKLWNSRNYFIATATYHFKYTHKLSVGISRLQSLTNVLRNSVPPQIIAKSKEYEQSLASLIIMLSIITPHFCCELWAGMRSAPNRICDLSDGIDWNQEVLQQRWPVVNENYPLSFQCKVDGADRCDLKIEATKLKNLDLEQAVHLMVREKTVAERITHGISKTKYELYPDCRAILHIYTNRHKIKQKSELKKDSYL
ncbi:probable leucine--tRNA ligase, mitochondrial isoform X1 [Maniola hyperantus]|uniref:probable leucine--tRNA ligase, mitochondrial isoform X1 n=1 Tax=Aphantopus hyperantus TaxID=2795564 RepID=UPI001569F527|nr:probable leucine--tRNA ligase, mitochondrial [Maniola hyperantus]